jgi:hypothetical protein
MSDRRPPQPPQMPPIQVDIAKGKDVRCENPDCGNYTFTECVLLKEFSAITSPNGKPGLVPIPVFACNACGFVNDMFLPPQMRKGGKIETSTLPPLEDAGVKAAASVAETKSSIIKIVK